MTMPTQRWAWGLGMLLITGLAAAPAALALPFDPLPSAFQRWLNAQRDWPQGNSSALISWHSALIKRPSSRPIAWPCSPV